MPKRKRRLVAEDASSSSSSSAGGQTAGEVGPQTLETILKNHEAAIATVWQKLKEIESMLERQRVANPGAATVTINVAGRVTIDPSDDEPRGRMGFRQGK